MTATRRFGAVLGVVGMLTLAGCQPANTQSGGGYASANNANTGNTSPGYGQAGGANPGYGVVQSIEHVPQASHGIAGSGIGIGTIAGAAIGGLLGNQVGGGTGKTVATVAGVAGGAYAGNQYDSSQQRPDEYRYTIRMQNGAYQTLTLATHNGLQVGDRVRIDNNTMQRY